MADFTADFSNRFPVKADIREGDEDNNFSVFRVRPEPRH